ncbi:unnamed protein product (mitochondrion) [Plasmodiophora brassicae]|uniref:Uncharacterized protein n=1 Tax=Plasmodiophora brassicae TaxID=37360 RepID=A0A3P3YN94_PLABS|nr:unnamed protein product [Plasmodiophora brassicae]
MARNAVRFRLASSNPITQPFLLWVLKLILRFACTSPERIAFSIDAGSKAEHCSNALHKAWIEQTKRAKPSMTRALLSAFGVPYLLLGLWKLVWTFCTWGCAWYFLKQLMSPATRSMSWAYVMLGAAALSAIAIQQVYSGAFIVGLKVRSSLTMLVYNKALVLPPEHVGIGEIVNMVSTDIEAVAQAATHWHFLWSGIVEVALVIALLIYEARLSAIWPVLIIVVALPFQLYLGKLVSRYSADWIKAAGERLHLMTEILTAVKLIKFYTWEQYFHERVDAVRKREAAAAASQIMARAVNFAIVFGIPVLGALACLYSLQVYGQLDASLSFVLVSLLNTLRYPLLMMPMAVKSISSASNALASLNAFMRRPELADQRQTQATKSDPAGKKGVVEITKADLTWGDDPTPTLASVSMHVYPGEVVAVVGTVGTGKSTLMASILGQTNIRDGAVRVVGRTSFCPQEAWLINASIQDNILFGTPMDRERYDKVIEVCCLGRDLSLFPDGDQTLVAERGANLSGGQKQRVSMARAVYAHSHIVLLDDPLSALDQKVGRTIFEKCIKGFLKDRAVVMVTHGLQYLYQVDRIMLMGDGGVVEYGTYTELMGRAQGRLRALVEQHVDISEESLDRDSDENVTKFSTIQIPDAGDDDADEAAAAAASGTGRSNLQSVRVADDGRGAAAVASPQRLPSDTDRRVVNRISQFNHGMELDDNTLQQKAEYDHQNTFGPYHSVSQLSNVPSFARNVARNELSVLTYRSQSFDGDDLPRVHRKDRQVVKGGALRYMQKGAGGVAASVLVCVLFFAVHGIRSGIDLWVKVWTGNTNGWGQTTNVIVFMVLCFAFTGGVALRGYLLAKGAAAKSRRMHDMMVDSLFHAPMAFYDRTPLGRILQTSSEHQADSDDRLPDAAMQMLQYMPLALAALVLMCMYSNVLLIPCCVVLVGIAVVIFMLPHWTGVLKFFKAQSKQAKPALYSHVATTLEGLFSVRAFGAQARFREETLAHLDATNKWEIGSQHVRYFVALYIDLVCAVIIFAAAYWIAVAPAKDYPPAVVGLILSNALQLLVFVGWALRMFEETLTSFKSITELQNMGNNITPEAPFEITDRPQPDASWPSKGAVDFKDIVLRYTEYGVAVLKRVTFEVKPTEKIGIVGRTGSGKSTLLNALLRIVESCNGKIVVDGVDVSKIGLRMLRKRIAIIPQEPVLFLGTVRTNLDPYSEHDNAEIWKALSAVNLDAIVRPMPGGLDAVVVENGRNFSLGQRQLFCVARAILSKSCIVVLDEATAAVDADTDAMVQEAVKKNFAQCTVLTIAHRLNTIIEYDKILFMDAGVVAEFDKPLTLLDNPMGKFTSLVNQTGAESARKLRQLAEEKAARELQAEKK